MEADRDCCYPPALQAAWRWTRPLAVVHLIYLLWRFGLAYLVRTPANGTWRDGLERPLEPAPAWISWLMRADLWGGWNVFLWDIALLAGSLAYWIVLLVILEWWAHTCEMRFRQRLEAEAPTDDSGGSDGPPGTTANGPGGS